MSTARDERPDPGYPDFTPGTKPPDKFATADKALVEITDLLAALQGAMRGGTLNVTYSSEWCSVSYTGGNCDDAAIRRSGASLSAVAGDLIMEARRRKAALSRW